jgi:hypothetical protein
VRIPAGACPVPLKGRAPEIVVAWAERVRAAFEAQRQYLMVEGLIYFTREFYDFNSPEYQEVKAVLLTTFADPKTPTKAWEKYSIEEQEYAEV